MEESVKESEGKRRGRYAVRAVVFAALLCVTLALLSALLTPMFGVEAKYSVQDAYDLPNNTVEVVAFGPSTLRRGVSPAYLYETDGLAVYNSCSDSQPPIAARYLLNDLLKTQKGTLKVVLLDAATLVKNTEFFDTSVGAERVLACMKPSLNKLQYMINMAEDYEDFAFEEHLVPVLRYHSRWAELDEEDFTGMQSGDAMKLLCGQPLYPAMFLSNISRGSGGAYSLDEKVITADVREASEEELEALWNAKCVHHIDQIVQTCKENGINVLLVTTPRNSWTDTLHDSVSLYADKHGLNYLDMSDSAVWQATGLSFDTDFYDSKHPNLLGSRKISKYLGDYLKQHYELSDVRGNSAYSYLEECSQEFERAYEDAQLVGCTNIEQYAEMLNRDRYTVFAAVYGEAADGLSAEAREKLSEAGFSGLAKLATNELYAGAAEGGQLVKQRRSDEEDQVGLYGSFDGKELILRQRNLQSGAILDDALKVVSKNASAVKATISLRDEDLCEGTRGISFVVYNHETGIMLDSSCFDTHEGSQRTSDVLVN